MVTRVRYLQFCLVFLLIPWFMSRLDVEDAWHLHAVRCPDSDARFPGESAFNVRCVNESALGFARLFRSLYPWHSVDSCVSVAVADANAVHGSSGVLRERHVSPSACQC